MSHSAGSRSWRNTCRTPPSQPKRITVITTISATDNRISFDETGQYQFRAGDKVCTGSTRKTRSFQRLDPVSVAANPPLKEGLTGARVASGAAETGFDFGLPDTPGAQPRRAVAAKTDVATPSVEGEDRRGGGAGAEKALTSASGHQALQDFSALLPSGSSKLAVPPAGRRHAGRALSAAVGYGPDDGTQRKLWFIGISSALALALAGLGLFQWSRPGSRRPEPASEGEQSVVGGGVLEEEDFDDSSGGAARVAVNPAAPATDPVSEDSSGPADSDHNQLTPSEGANSRRFGDEQSDGAAVGAGVSCPACGEIYTKGEKFCGNDGSSLVGSTTPTD